jgi:apolipoprotein N-acyltransferase
VNGAVRAGDPDLIVNLTNDAWFGTSTEPAIHLALAKYRAVEHHRYLVRATNTGVSAWIDAAGRSRGETKLFQLVAQSGEIRWMRGKTVYEIVGDVPWWAATLVVFAMGFVERRKVFAPKAA